MIPASAQSVGAPAASAQWRDWAACGSLILLVWGVFFPTLFGGFLWYDNILITGNPLITSPGHLADIWLGRGTPDYWPVTYTSWWIDWRIFGRSPAGYHALNVSLHSLSAVLLWRILKQLALPGAWIAAAIWAVHPVNVESVAWIAERKNTLSMCLALGSVLAWMASEKPRRREERKGRREEILFYCLSIFWWNCK